MIPLSETLRINNNPVAIRHNDRNKWQGMKEPQEGFCSFESLKACARAWALILVAYSERNICSYRDIIFTYAPPEENNSDVYASYIAQKMATPYDGRTRGPESINDLFILFRLQCVYETKYSISHAAARDLFVDLWITDASLRRKLVKMFNKNKLFRYQKEHH